MKDLVSLISNKEEKNTLILSEYIALKFNLTFLKRGYISFGNRKHFVDIKISKNLEDKEIYLSKNIMDYLYLPPFLELELSVNGKEFILGPYIGLLLYKDKDTLSPSSLKKLSIYTLNYSSLHGAIVVFALNSVDAYNRLIEGYCYNPQSGLWESGIFPYPLAIYRKIGISNYWKNHFLSNIGDGLFNDYYFNKLEMYEYLKEFNNISSSLPVTSLYRNSQDIYSFLYKYNKIILKPLSGMQGKGIVKIELDSFKILFSYRENNLNKKLTLNTPEELESLAEALLIKEKFIIQEAIELIQHEGRIIDFRVIMQKDEHKEWQCNGIISRIGEKESIVSNISSCGTALYMEELFRNFFGKSEEEIFLWKEYLSGLAIKVCHALNQSGLNCGTLGLDLAIDNKGKIWIIEVNNRDPDPTIALDVKDNQLYYKVKSAPLFYGKALSGF